MADLFVSALIRVVQKKAADSLVQRIGEMWGIDDQRQRLQIMLLEIEARLPDAEERAISNTAVKSWLERLKSATYDANDTLDMFCYEELRRDAVRRGHKVGNVSGFFSHENPVLFRYKMSGKLKKSVGIISDLVVQMRAFGFELNQHGRVANYRDQTDSHVVESIVGRDEDKEKIVNLLLGANDSVDLTIVPIVGMGGLGKTTLAQLVYNDPRIKERFKLQLWRATKEAFTPTFRWKEIFPCSRLLDDVWNEDIHKWEQLRALLNCGESGSVIIVTTRNGMVASIMGTVNSYNLRCLGDDESWNLFHKRAFSKGLKESQELVEIGKKIVQNCGGLPLAINTLGSLMSYKYQVQEWLIILEESMIWGTRSTNDEVLPVLRLSYNHLPPYMKQCFAFCAVFPKDCEMDKEKLIQYWMANGFIPSDHGPGSLERKGDEIFKELAWRSFFQDVKVVNYRRGRYGIYRSKTKCKMHDLMHVLAQSIVDYECLSTLELPTKSNQSKIYVRHISYKKFPSDINNFMNSFPSIRSLISTNKYGIQYSCNVSFLRSSTLQILELHATSIGRTMVTPEKMKHLRYLEIRNVNTTSLPEAITTLYLLQTLRLVDCWKLVKLPEGMKYMSTLRHLNIQEEPFYTLRSMPSGLGQLNNLQVLTIYIVGTESGNFIGELKNLNLHGTLHLYNIRKVSDAANAIEANLVAKHHLDDLALCWGLPADYKNSFFKVAESNYQEVMHNDPHEVLDALKPYSNLKVLQVAQYPGNEFPVWMTEYVILANLIELYIIDCRKCTNIPPVDKLPFLQILYLKFFDNLSHLCNSGSTRGDIDGDSQVVFASLNKLVLFEMPNLSSWCEGEVRNETSLVFPKLKKLEIINCPKLIAMPDIPKLKEFSVKGNRTLSCIATRLSTLRVLSLEKDGGDTESANEILSFQSWESLDRLELCGYNNIVPTGTNEGEEPRVTPTKCHSLILESSNFLFSLDVVPNSLLWFWKCFIFVKFLSIRECDNFIYWPEKELTSLNCLTSISVSFCPNFLGSQQESPYERSITETLLPKLELMWLCRCPNMVEIPNCSASTIQTLIISDCEKLQCLPEWLGSMVALKELKIEYCENLHSLPSSIGLTSLEKLEISNCPKLANLPGGMEGLKALKALAILECPKIGVLPKGLLQQLKNLDKLRIERCPHLEWKFRIHCKYRSLTSKIPIAKIGGDPVDLI